MAKHERVGPWNIELVSVCANESQAWNGEEGRKKKSGEHLFIGERHANHSECPAAAF